MTAEVPLAPDAKPPRRRRKTYTFWWCFLGLCAEALLFLLSTLSDACVLPPPFEAMELKDTPKPYYAVGERIHYKCKKGYIFLYPFVMSATCEQNHTWEPISDHACAKVDCTTLADPSFGKVHYPDGKVSWGSRAQFTCVDGQGFLPCVTALAPGTCFVDKAGLKLTETCLKACTAIPGNNILTLSGKSTFSYYLVGMSTLHCELKGDDAYWNGPPPHCEKVYCLPPPKIKNGTHTFTDIDIFQYNEAVIYSCDPHPGPDKFSLIGMRMLFCSGHNTWSSRPPECKVVKCPFPVLQNGRRISGFEKNFSYEATVIFECMAGFYMNGSDTVVCNANSTWEPPVPVCLKGPKPTHPSKPPVYNYPGYPNPQEGIFGQELDAWIFVLIIITSIVGVVVICFIILRFLEFRKKMKTSVKAQSTTSLKKSTLPGEKTASLPKNPKGNVSFTSNLTVVAAAK